MNANIILDVKNLCTSFKTDNKVVDIVKNISFQLKRGTTLALVGESGCGKSVTVHSITNLMPKNALIKADYVSYYSAVHEGGSKEFRLDTMKRYGKQMRSIRGSEIGMVFQDPMSSLNPVYKAGTQVIENLMEHSDISKSDAMEKAQQMFEKLGIPDAKTRINSYPHQLSGGMKQRVVIAIAMICNPDLIIADEPTTALDVTIQAQIMELMKDLQVNDGKSIILITHNMGVVAEMADEVAVMYMGRIVEFGSLEQIFDNPRHPYTKALLKSVPVIGMKKGTELTTIKGITPNPSELAEGCEFADRCEECTISCRQNDIPNYEVENGHNVRCIKYANYREVN